MTSLHLYSHSFLSPEEQQHFESEAAVQSVGYPRTVSNVMSTGSVNQDYLSNKTELDRQCNELMVSSYDSSVGLAQRAVPEQLRV